MLTFSMWRPICPPCIPETLFLERVVGGLRGVGPGLLPPAEQGVEPSAAALRHRGAAALIRIGTRHEPAAEIGPCLVVHRVGRQFAALPGTAGIVMAA